jgi:hypothetical protein
MFRVALLLLFHTGNVNWRDGRVGKICKVCDSTAFGAPLTGRPEGNVGLSVQVLFKCWLAAFDNWARTERYSNLMFG